MQAIAHEHGVTESDLLKKLVDAALLQGTGSPDLNIAERVGAVARNARVFVRLRPEDHVLLRERAAGRGMAAATYASIVLRTHLWGVARIPDREFAELKRAAELGAIGRTLNQIARVANETRRVRDPSAHDLQAGSPARLYGAPGPRERTASCEHRELGNKPCRSVASLICEKIKGHF